MCARSIHALASSLSIQFLFVTSLFAGTPSNTEFSYQGQLKRDGVPVNGPVDLDVELWDADVGGNQIGLPVSIRATPVTDGIFQVSLDFGPNALDGLRWLAISVRNPAGSGSFEDVLPRQRITSSPYSIQTRGIFVDENDSVGLGTPTPKARLHNTGDYYGRGHIFLHSFDGDGADGTAYLQARDDSGTSSIDLRLRTQEAGAIRDSLSLSSNGNVGIGTNTPVTRLDVQGGSINIGNTGDQATLLGFATERSWAFKQQASGSNTALKLQSIGGGGAKNFLIETGGSVGIGTLAPQAKLHVEGGSVANLSGGGYVQCGETSGFNVVIDHFNIAARNNGQAATLYLNHNSGDVIVAGMLDIGLTVVSNSGGGSDVEVDCPAETNVISGGCYGGTNEVEGSIPRDDRSGWICNFNGDFNIAYAICARVK